MRRQLVVFSRSNKLAKYLFDPSTGDVVAKEGIETDFEASEACFTEITEILKKGAEYNSKKEDPREKIQYSLVTIDNLAKTMRKIIEAPNIINMVTKGVKIKQPAVLEKAQGYAHLIDEAGLSDENGIKEDTTMRDMLLAISVKETHTPSYVEFIETVVDAVISGTLAGATPFYNTLDIDGRSQNHAGLNAKLAELCKMAMDACPMADVKLVEDDKASALANMVF